MSNAVPFSEPDSVPLPPYSVPVAQDASDVWPWNAGLSAAQAVDFYYNLKHLHINGTIVYPPLSISYTYRRSYYPAYAASSLWRDGIDLPSPTPSPTGDWTSSPSFPYYQITNGRPTGLPSVVGDSHVSSFAFDITLPGLDGLDRIYDLGTANPWYPSATQEFWAGEDWDGDRETQGCFVELGTYWALLADGTCQPRAFDVLVREYSKHITAEEYYWDAYYAVTSWGTAVDHYDSDGTAWVYWYPNLGYSFYRLSASPFSVSYNADRCAIGLSEYYEGWHDGIEFVANISWAGAHASFARSVQATCRALRGHPPLSASLHVVTS